MINKVNWLIFNHHSPGAQFQSLINDLSRDEEIKKISVFTDSHIKEGLTIPSGVAIMCQGLVLPPLTYPSLNCGMSFFKTSLKEDELKTENIDRLFEVIKKTIPSLFGKPLRREELIGILKEGATYILKKNNWSLSQREFIENRGCMFEDGEVDDKLLLKCLPKTAFLLGRYNFSSHGIGTHFIELQVIKEILDKEFASCLNLKTGQITFLIHNGSAMLGEIIGRFYGGYRDKRRNIFLKYLLLGEKLPFHLKNSRNISKIWRYYFSEKKNVLKPSSPDYHLYWTALKVAMNYGYANRASIGAKLREVIQSLFGKIDFSYLWDASHSSVMEEIFEGEKYFVYRNDVCKVLAPSMIDNSSILKRSGYPIIKPSGVSNSTFICVGEEGVKEYLCSIDQGIPSSYLSQGKERKGDLSTTARIYRYSCREVEIVKYRSEDKVLSLMEFYKRKRILKPVIRTSPLASLKE